MNNEIKIFNNEEFGNMRTATVDGEYLFCLSDICKALSLSQPSKVRERLNEKGVHTIPTLTKGGKQNLLYINEANLYKTIFQSRKPSAEKFTDWVTEEVLPALRKTGSYSMPGNTNQQIALLAQGHMELVQNLEAQKQIIQSQQQDIDIIKERLHVVGAYDNEWMLQNIKSATAARVLRLTADPINQVLWSRYFFAGIYKMLKSVFHVASLSSIPAGEYESALHIITEWTPTSVFLEQRLADMQAKKDKNLLPDKKVIALLQYINATSNGTVNPFASIEKTSKICKKASKILRFRKIALKKQ